MADKSSIEWLDGGSTWPVIRGCTKCSPGCDNCWAISDAHLHAGSKNAKAAAHFTGLTQIQNGRPNGTGEVRLDESILELPLKWRKPRKVFVASSGDLFHDSLLTADRDRVFRVMRSAPQHTYLILTKRAEQMREYFSDWLLAGDPLPANWWPGVSVEDNERARLRLPWLVKIPAAVRWVSYEPALGPVNWAAIPGFDPFVSWVVIGGESGRGARPFDLAWARDTIAQCRAAGVPVFMKQMGALVAAEDAETKFPCPEKFWVMRKDGVLHGGPVLRSRKGSDPSEWPGWARVREWPRERGEGGK